MKCDVLIIGAGPAGLFAANELAGKFNVVVVDKGRNLN
jgi:flavin-dependent dehydrogenase